MNLRKLLYLPSPDQSTTIVGEIETIKQRCVKLAETERKEQTENQRSRDSRCPRCRAKSDKIVDRIAQVEAKTNIRGNALNMKGVLLVETKPVNHCNVCGHEWEKFRTKTITNFEITKVILDYLSDIIRNPERNKRYSWKHEYMEVFKDCHAESIKALQKQYSTAIRYPLTLRQLRTKYKSVFDKKES